MLNKTIRKLIYLSVIPIFAVATSANAVEITKASWGNKNLLDSKIVECNHNKIHRHLDHKSGCIIFNRGPMLKDKIRSIDDFNLSFKCDNGPQIDLIAKGSDHPGFIYIGCTDDNIAVVERR